MANVFGILTMIVLLLAGFVAFKNKERYEKELAETATREEDLRRSQARLETAQQDLAQTIATRQGVEEENEQLTADESSKQKIRAEKEADLKTKTAKRNANQQELDGIRERTARVGDLKELAPKMKANRAELEELSQDITAAEARLANLTAQNNQLKSRIDGMNQVFETFRSGRSLPTLNTRIRSIFPSWGFVTLAAGNNAGVMANSTLDVVRDGQVIARLLVTNVEANSASASIVPDSLASDVTLMVGDRVVPGSPPPPRDNN